MKIISITMVLMFLLCGGCFMFHDNPSAPPVKPPNGPPNDWPVFKGTNTVATNDIPVK